MTIVGTAAGDKGASILRLADTQPASASGATAMAGDGERKLVAATFKPGASVSIC